MRSKYESEVNAAARDLVRAGFEILDVSDQSIPDALRRHSPDLVGRRGDEHVIVEVKDRRSSSRGDHLRELAEAVRSMPGWRLDLRWLGDVPPGPTPAEILTERLARARGLLDVDVEAAFLLGWSTFEGFTLLVAQKNNMQTPSSLNLARLEDEGVLSEEEHIMLQVLRHVRNDLVHGRGIDSVDRDQVVRFLDLTLAVSRRLSDGQGKSAVLIDQFPLSVGAQEYPLRAYVTPDGRTVCIVEDVPGGTSLMNASERIMRAAQARYPGALVIEYWPNDPSIGPFRLSDGQGGSSRIDIVDYGISGTTAA